MPDKPVTNQQPGGIIPLAEPELRGNEWAYIKECLDTNWVSSAGSFVDRFERELANRVGLQHAIATSSGTAALHIALLVAGVEAEDEVLVSTLTFIAPANAVRYIGAWPLFVDADPKYWQMDTDKLVDFVENGCRWEDGSLINKNTGRRVKAILPVHILGHPCDMEPILEVARKFGLAVVEDATESLGAKYKGEPVGQQGDISCFSFNGNKMITTGGGGMILTDNPDWAARAKHLTTQAKSDSIEYIHDEVGYNYRLTNIQAAMGCAQIERLDHHLEAKLLIAQRYGDALADIPGITYMDEAPWASSAFWMSTILVDQQDYGIDSRTLLKRLKESGIDTRPLWQPMHVSQAHIGSQAGPCGVSETIFRDGLSLPCSVGLKPEQQERVTDALRRSGG